MTKFLKNVVSCIHRKSHVRSLTFTSNRYKSKNNKQEFTRTDVINALTKDYDISLKGFSKWLIETREKQRIKDQSFDTERTAILGYDLAAAVIVLEEGGAVKFKHQDYWMRLLEDEENSELPEVYNSVYKIEGIDLTGVIFTYEGLENIKVLILRNSPLVDDWFVDRISGGLKHSLKRLDLRQCPKVTNRGLECLYRMTNLKYLILDDNLPLAEHLQLTLVMLQETNPDLHVFGLKKFALEFM